MMTIPEESALLRIFCGEDDRHGHMPLYEAIILKAREAGLAGATMLRGITGFGHSSHLHTAKILRLSQDLPIVIEIVDAREKIEAFLPTDRRHAGQRPGDHGEGAGAAIRPAGQQARPELIGVEAR